MKLVMILIAVLSLGACSVNVNHKDENLSYDLTENGCKTERHEFSSQDDYCNGLKNDSLNNFCASSLRYSTFQQNCPGRSWQN